MLSEQEIKDVIVETLSVKPQELKEGQSLYDCLGVDSTEIVDLRVALEKKFSIKIEAKEISKSSSVKDIVNLIEKKKKAS